MYIFQYLFVIILYLVPMQSMTITTEVVSSNPAQMRCT